MPFNASMLDSIVYLKKGISMAEGSSGHRNTSFGYLQPVPKDYGGKQITSCDDRVRQGEQSSFHQKTSNTSCVDKQTGKYTRTTNKEVVSTGETFKDRSTGRVGYKDEYKTTFTYRAGDKCGYTERQLEEKFVRFDYSGSSGNNKGKNSAGSNKNDEDDESDEDEGGEGYKKYEESDEGEDEDNDEDEESDGDEGVEEYSYYGDSDDYGYSDSD